MTMRETRKTWLGSKTCDLCHKPIMGILYDASLPTHGHVWATLCLPCATSNHVMLGTGKGQKYRQEGDSGTFYKIAG